MILDADRDNARLPVSLIYAKSNSQEQKTFNKEALKILETKKSQLTIEQQSIGTSIIPAHEFKANFVEYFEEYIKLNKREGNRHLTCCLAKLQQEIEKFHFDNFHQAMQNLIDQGYINLVDHRWYKLSQKGYDRLYLSTI